MPNLVIRHAAPLGDQNNRRAYRHDARLRVGAIMGALPRGCASVGPGSIEHHDLVGRAVAYSDKDMTERVALFGDSSGAREAQEAFSSSAGCTAARKSACNSMSLAGTG